MHNQQKLINFALSIRQRVNSHVELKKIFKMNDEKFKLRIIEVVALLIKFRKMTDKSDKRILRDYIRAVVKEMTLV